MPASRHHLLTFYQRKAWLLRRKLKRGNKVNQYLPSFGDRPNEVTDILGWDDKKEREHFLAEQHTQSSWTKPAVAGLPERPGRIDFSEKYGNYRKVSARVSDIYLTIIFIELL